MLICGYRNQTTEFWNYGGVEDHDSKILACRFDNANDAIEFIAKTQAKSVVEDPQNPDAWEWLVLLLGSNDVHENMEPGEPWDNLNEIPGGGIPDAWRIEIAQRQACWEQIEKDRIKREQEEKKQKTLAEYDEKQRKEYKRLKEKFEPN